MSRGVAFLVDEKRLMWWCKTPKVTQEVLDQVSRYVPAKVIHEKANTIVF